MGIFSCRPADLESAQSNRKEAAPNLFIGINLHNNSIGE